MTREPETGDGAATPAARGLPDHLDLLAEPLRSPVRERDEVPGAVPPSGTVATGRHEPGAGVGEPTGGTGGSDRPAPEMDLARRQDPTASVPAPRPDPDVTRALPIASSAPTPAAAPEPGTAPVPAADTRPGTHPAVHHGGGSHAGARPGAWTPPPHVAPEAPSARHRRQPWAVIVLAMLFALTLVLATYLVVLTRAHEERAAQWEQVARTTGTELAQQRVELDGAIAELEAVRTQLQTAQTRITELADEKAQIGDEREAQRQLVDYQARVSDAAGKVAGALDVCVDGQYQLISYLENAAAYDAADLARFRTDVQQVCGAARDANAALQLELER